MKDQDAMLDETWAETKKKCKHMMSKVESSFHFENENKYILIDRIYKAKREIANMEIYLDLWQAIPNIGFKEKDGVILKVPLRNEIRGVCYAMMIAYGLYSLDEIREKYDNDFYGEDEYGKNVGLTFDEVEQIAEFLQSKWEDKKQYFVKQKEERLKKKG